MFQVLCDKYLSNIQLLLHHLGLQFLFCSPAYEPGVAPLAVASGSGPKAFKDELLSAAQAQDGEV